MKEYIKPEFDLYITEIDDVILSSTQIGKVDEVYDIFSDVNVDRI